VAHVRVDGIVVNYEAIGEGRPLVVIPGWPDEWRVPADYLEPAFEDHPGWHRIYLDLPGRGGTPGEAWITSNDQVLEIVLQVIDRLVGEDQFVLAGHSAGAYLARAVVAHDAARVDGLVQVVPEIDRDGDAPEHVVLVEDRDLLRRIDAELGPQTASEFASFFVVQSTATYERLKVLLPNVRTADREFLSQLQATLSFEVDPPAAPFSCPALFILGRQDSVVGYRGAFDLIEHYPRATIAVLDGAGHGLPWEQPSLLTVLVRDWLDRVDEAGR
jgi:pimeloyl-ACP methyl ester carboxylesterase